MEPQPSKVFLSLQGQIWPIVEPPRNCLEASSVVSERPRAVFEHPRSVFEPPRAVFESWSTVPRMLLGLRGLSPAGRGGAAYMRRNDLFLVLVKEKGCAVYFSFCLSMKRTF